jgi:EAL domain-containing protein (putative c-di-GMP-specific phosphodiesterase class I)
LDEKTLAPHVDEALRVTGVDPRALEIEITESVLMRDVEGTVTMLRALKDRGIAISIDDFGTGYSSLSYLKRFPIDTLKIDRSFIRDVVGNPDGHAIVCAIVALARRLQLCIVAEGVETQEQADVLRREHVDFAQGHYYGKALPAEFFQAHFGAKYTPRLVDLIYAMTG